MPDRDFDALRGYFPLLAQSQQTLHYLDSAASSHKPDCVIDAISDCYRHHYSPVHRGLYTLAENASELYEGARSTLARFVNAPGPEQIVFTRSATEAINLVATGWAGQHIQPGEEIWLSAMEHHSNFLPWQRVCQQRGATLKTIQLDANGELDWQNSPGLFGSKTRLIAVTQISNVLGVTNPISAICAAAGAHQIPVLVDAAQSLGHIPVDVEALGCDFLVASAHKMCGPSGIGLLYARADRLAETEPMLLGGGMVDEVEHSGSSWAQIPARFEAGSPNLPGAIGFARAADYLSGIGLPAIARRVQVLTRYAIDTLYEIPGITLYGPAEAELHSGILSFNIAGIHAHDLAHIAAEQGVAIRAGHHCCQPLMRSLGVSSTARASFALYNNEADIQALGVAIAQAKKLLGSHD